MFQLFFLSAVTVAGAAAPATQAVCFSHHSWAEVLERFVNDEGLVDYQSLARDRTDLDRYLASIAEISPTSDRRCFPSRNHELAYYLNTYNAWVFDGVLNRGPEEVSVWRGLVPGLSFFVLQRFTSGDKRMSLKKLEDKIIRKDFADARIHAALNCASIGCPRLPRQPFLGETLDAQLDAAMEEFASAERNVAIDLERGEVSLSEIFTWFEGDFLDHERRLGNSNPTLIDAINRYRRPVHSIPSNLKLVFPDYDRRLNQQP